MRSICNHQALVPRSLAIPLCYDPNTNPVNPSGRVDVWKGRHHGKEVAAKVLRVSIGDDLEEIGRVGLALLLTRYVLTTDRVS